jgi:hypothetical protein
MAATVPEILWIPESGPRTISFPQEVSQFELRKVPAARQVETAGGIVATHRGFTYDLARISIPKMGFDQTFSDEMVAFTAWAMKGGEFVFALNDDTILNGSGNFTGWTTLLADAPITSTGLDLDPTPPHGNTGVAGRPTY